MNNNKGQNEQNEQEELRDLDVPEKDSEGVKGGWVDMATPDLMVKPKPKDPAPGR